MLRIICRSTDPDAAELLDFLDQSFRRPHPLRDVGADAQRLGLALARRARATRGDRRGAARAARPAPRTSVGRAAAPTGESPLRASVRSRSAAIGSSSVATSRADSSSFSNLPRTSSIASASMSDAVLAERLREHHHFDAAGDVVEHEHRHAVALLGLQRAQAGDDAADPDVGQRRR